jgi:hypothetical protein
MTSGHTILQVYPTDDFKVYLYFEDGRIKMFDASELKENGIFQKLRNIDFFKKNCTVLNKTLAWDLSGRYDPSDCLDLDPDELYATCQEVKEPVPGQSDKEIGS